MGYTDLDSYKKDIDIYEYLNSESKSYNNLLRAIQNQDKLVKNMYSIKKKTFDIFIKNTIYNEELLSRRSSNIDEFFNVIDW